MVAGIRECALTDSPALASLKHGDSWDPVICDEPTRYQEADGKLLWTSQTHPHLPSHLSCKAETPKCFFCASALKTDQKAHSVRASRGSGDRGWTDPNTRLLVHSGWPLGNHTPQSPREKTHWEEAGRLRSVKHIR